MAIEQTFAIIKPDAYPHASQILTRMMFEGFFVIACKRILLRSHIAAHFYREHRGKDFFNPLVEFMASGPSLLLILEKENAVADWRKLIGSSDPKKAEVGTIRQGFGTGGPRNAVHGSDSVESALREISFFYSGHELMTVPDFSGEMFDDRVRNLSSEQWGAQAQIVS